MMLNDGELDGVRIFKPETVKLMTSVQSPERCRVAARPRLGHRFALQPAARQGFPLGSYGHTGWTGTALWIDPFSKTFWIFLSNRVHPDGKGQHPAAATHARHARGRSGRSDSISRTSRAHCRTRLHCGTCCDDQYVAAPPNVAQVLNGIDVLVKQNFAPLKKLRIGLDHQSHRHDRERNPTIDLLNDAPGVQLKALFSPEHGIRGELDEKVADSVDEKTGCPFTAFTARRAQRRTPEQLRRPRRAGLRHPGHRLPLLHLHLDDGQLPGSSRARRS